MKLFLLLIQIPILIFIIKYIRKLHSDPLLVNSYYYILLFKVTAGLVLGILYFKYYKLGDTVFYYDDLECLSKIFYSNWRNYLELILLREIPNGLENIPSFFYDTRAYAFIRIVSPFYILSGSNYWMTSVYLSIFSFLGLWILSNSLIKIYTLKPVVVLLSFFVFPSVVFWSSGVIKESLIIGIMGVIMSIILELANRCKKISLINLIILMSFSFVLLYIKFYYFAVLFAVLVPYGIITFFNTRSNVSKMHKSFSIYSYLFLLALMAIIASYFHPLLHFDRISEALYTNYTLTLKFSKGINVYFYEGLSSNPSSFLIHIPKAVIYGLFAPFLVHCSKTIMLIAGIENTILLILFTSFLWSNFKKEKLKAIKIETIGLLVYVLVLAILMAFASPHFGSIVRYKVGYLPFFLLLILNNNPVILHLDKLVKFLNLSEKKS